jgi:hypothetical protein
MSRLDQIYQNAVDRETEKALRLSVSEINNYPDYGNIEAVINNQRTTIAFWNWKLSDRHHLVFLTQRRILLIFYRKYLGGVKVENNQVVRLSNEELGNYD